MAAVSNYSQHPSGAAWLMYSKALGGAVRERTPGLHAAALLTDHNTCGSTGRGALNMQP